MPPVNKTPLTDAEIDQLGQQGFQEGSFVPGKGVLTPLGTFREPRTGEVGFKGPSLADVSTGLEKARQSALDIQKKVQDLKKSQQAEAPSDAIVSTEKTVQDERTVVQQIKTLQGPDASFEALRISSREALDELDKQAEALETRRKAEIESIKRASEEAIKATKGAQAREKGTFGVTLARIGGFLGESASAIGAMRNLSAEHKAEISSLESKRNAAIAAANSAINDKQFDIAREKANEVRSLEEDIDDRRNKFFDQALSLVKEQRQQDERNDRVVNQIRDDSRSVLNTILTNFGGIDFSALDESTAADFSELAALAGLPIEVLAQPTLKQKAQVSTEQQRAISNAISAARLQIQQQSLQISLARFAESEKLNAVDAQRLGLPKSLVGLSENEVEDQLRETLPPSWFVEIEENKPVPVTTREELISAWEEFRNEILTTNPLVDFGGLGLPPAVQG